MIKYIYNSKGRAAAYIVGENVFLTDSHEWFARLENGNQVYSPMGEYIGFLSDDDRILCENPKPIKPFKGLASLPPLPPLPPLPQLRGLYPLLPINLVDILDDD